MRLFLTAFFAIAAACQASDFTVTLVQDTLSGLPGDTLNFFGTLQNNSTNTDYIYSDNLQLPGFGDITGFDTPFLTFAPISLGPGESAGPFQFLSILVPLGLAPGSYDGSLDIFGGADGGAGTANDDLGTVLFQVDVQNPAPEPATPFLVGAGLVALGFGLTRKKLRA